MEDWNIRIVKGNDVYHWSMKTPDKINFNGISLDIRIVPNSANIMHDIIVSLAEHISRMLTVQQVSQKWS